ncbi:hemocytin [Ixodes scapularis]
MTSSDWLSEPAESGRPTEPWTKGTDQRPQGPFTLSINKVYDDDDEGGSRLCTRGLGPSRALLAQSSSEVVARAQRLKFPQCIAENSTPTDIVYNHTAVETTTEKCKRFVYLVNGPMPLPASSYKASSSASPASDPNHSRLGTTSTRTSLGAWIPRRQGAGEFVEVDLGRVQSLFGVTTQGRDRTQQWVTHYRVLVSADGVHYAYVQGADGEVKDFLGNHDASGVVRQLFEPPVRARFVRLEPIAWNELIALRFDVLGCIDETATSFVSLCPEIPENLRQFCPSCPQGHLCDGSTCVPESHCPCFQDEHLFHVNTIIKTRDCNTCTCSLNGHSKCARTVCRCTLEGKRSTFDRDCNCKCEYCPPGQRLCRTSNECIDEFKWCNGVKDCPDDEQDCANEPQGHPPAISPCPTAKKPNCPKGQYPKMDRNARCPEYVCVPEGDEDVCKVLANAGICMVAGNSVKTFDGQEFRYEICDHILLQDKKSKQFSVTAHKRCHRRGDISVCEKSVSIMCNDVFVKLGPTLQEVKVNGSDVPTRSLQTISRRLKDVLLALSGQRLLFASHKHNFQVELDERQNIKIGVSECLSDTISGLCGSFNYDRADDLRTPDGRLESSGQVFGDSWMTTAKASCSPSSCPHDVHERARNWCHKLKEAPLSQCLEASSTSMSINICEDFVCECMAYSENDAKKCMCQAIEGFVATCDASVRQKIASEWRLLLGCAPKCPAGMEWRDCGPACEKTCENMRDKFNECTEDCVSGCFCPMGLVRRGDTCVPPEFCHDCVCRGHGDPNYITFDGHYYDFQGTCSYVLAQHVSGDSQLDFQVLGINVECPEEPRTTCTQGLAISYRNHHVRITKGQRVKFNDYELQDRDYPWDKKGFNISWVPGRSTVVYVPEISLVVRYFELNYGFSIELPSFTYFNKTEGLCGVCNFDQSDDLLHKNGRLSTDIPSFAYSWLVEGTPEICKVQATASKRSVPREICEFERNACELYVDPDLYQKSCLNDASYTRNLSASVCRSKLQYAEHCCSQGGVSVHHWLKDSGCDSGCPRNMELRCDSGCPKTCANYRTPAEVCPLSPSYSCFCKNGFVLKNGECVAIKNCEACDEQGHLIGDSWQVSPCETCECGENLKVRCTSILCPAPPTCRNDEKLIHLPRSNGTCCDAYLCDANLLSSCKPPSPVACQPGAVSKLKTNDDGCPSYFCECDLKQCPSLQWPANLEQGLEAFVELQGCCNKVSVRCNPQRCQDMPNCPPDTELLNEPGECCTTYKCVPKNKCAYIHQYKVVNGMQMKLHPAQQYQKMYPPESSWSDGLCTNCSCSQRFNQYQYSCRVEVCPGEQQDTEDYEYTVDTRASGVCCPKQVRTACKGGGLVYKIGSEWALPGEKKCRSYRCERSPTTGEAVKAVLTQICNTTCLRSEKYVEPRPGSNDCCGRCLREFCEENHNLYQVGEKWTSTLRPCFSVHCLRGVSGAVEMKYTLKTCPPLPSNCPKNNIVRDETGCCQKCQVTPGSCRPHTLDAANSLQYFTLSDRSRGLCSNSEPIPDLKECTGQCYSSTIYSPDTNNFTSSCRCCTIKSAVQKTVTLTCTDGSKIQKQYQNPTECACTLCGEPARGSTGIAEPTPL